MIAIELQNFYQKHGFGEVPGKRPRTVSVYTGCMLVPLPNIETRRRFLKYHDLHHLVTGYSVGRIGEGEVSAWELGTGSAFTSPMLGMMNLIALSTGLFLDRQRMWNAFKKGCRSKNLYSRPVRHAVDTDRWQDIGALRQEIFEIHTDPIPQPLRTLEFGLYAGMAMAIHFLLVIPAIICRIVTDLTLGYNFFQVIKPKQRTDLF